MKSDMKVLRALWAICIALLAIRSEGQLTKIHEYALHQPEGRGALFETALTPDHALLTLVVHEDGEWPLTLVRNWWEEHPKEQQIRLSAFSKREKLISPIGIRLLSTPDGQFAVLLISAGIPAAQGDHHTDEMVIYVVRLDPFQVVASARSKTLGIDGLLNGFLDPAGHPVVIASIYPAVRTETTKASFTYYRLAMPDLHLGATCNYSLPLNSNTETAGILEKSCSEFAKDGGFSSAADMDKHARDDAEHPKPPFQANNNFGWPFINEGKGIWLGTSANSEEMVVLNDNGDIVHRFEPGAMCGRQPVRGPAWICDCKLLGGAQLGAVVECETSHDSLFGSSVGLKQWIAEIDVEHDRDVSRVDIPIRDSFEAKLVEIGSTKFLLAVVNGSRLQIFSVSTSS